MNEKQTSVRVSPYLTSSDLKRSLYSVDPFFREGWEDAVSVWGENQTVLSLNTAAIVFKPEAIAGRKVKQGLDFLRNHQFVPIAAATFWYNRHIIREAWRYQLNIATRERLAIVDILETTTPSLCVFFRDDRRKDDFPATTRLSKLKGSSIPSRRHDGELRRHLGDVSVLINYVHTPDDPADMLREIAIYFSDVERFKLLMDIRSSKNIEMEVRFLVDNLYSNTHEHDLSFELSRRRIRELWATKMHDEGISSREYDVLKNAVIKLDRLTSSTICNWHDIFGPVDALNVEVNIWDRILIATQITESNLPGLLPVL